MIKPIKYYWTLLNWVHQYTGGSHHRKYNQTCSFPSVGIQREIPSDLIFKPIVSINKKECERALSLSSKTVCFGSKSFFIFSLLIFFFFFLLAFFSFLFYFSPFLCISQFFYISVLLFLVFFHVFFFNFQVLCCFFLFFFFFFVFWLYFFNLLI